MTATPLTLLVNPTSGRGRALATEPAVVAALQGAGFDPQVVRSTSLARVAQIAAASAHPVAVLGGDGTVGRALAGAVESGVVVLPLPGGRGNDLCRALGITGTAEQVAAASGRYVERRIDLGDVAGRPFAGVLSLGLDAAASRHANQTRVPGSAAYVWGAVRALLSERPVPVRITVDGVAADETVWFCSVSNSGWFGAGKHVAPHGSIEDGLVDVVTAGGMSRLGVVPVLLGLFTGAHVRMRGVTVRTGRDIVIEPLDRGRGPTSVRADGEAVGQLPVQVTVRRGGARVLAPPREGPVRVGSTGVGSGELR